MSAALEEVQRVARRSGSSFYYAFLTLPRERREAITAVYAWCHAVDDAVDDAPDDASAARNLERWRRALDEAFAGREADAISTGAALMAARMELPRALFDEVLEGVGMDIGPRRFATFAELERYCDLVAGAVGRLCVRIFGRRDAEADAYARDLGLALQLTNILRDLGPDARMGRFYLPLEDLERYGIDEAAVLDEADARRLPLLDLQASRAREAFARAEPVGHRHRRDFYAAEIMATIYRRLLERVEAARFPVAEGPLRLPKSQRALLALRAFARCRWF